VSLAISEPPPLADGDHYREMAGRLRELARDTHSPDIRRELVDLAKRYERRGDHFDGRSRSGLSHAGRWRMKPSVMNFTNVIQKEGKSKRKIAASIAAVAVGCLFAAAGAARANTIIWANDARGMPGPTIEEWSVNVGGDSSMLVTSFVAPNPAAQGQSGEGIAVVGSNIYYSVFSSGSVFLTNPSGTDLGIVFSTGLPGISSIASDGQFLYLAPTGATNYIYKYTLGGSL
jgi:hypothetical protein